VYSNSNELLKKYILDLYIISNIYIRLINNFKQKENKMKKIIKDKNICGFYHNDQFISDPFISECARFQVDPKKYYNLTEKQIYEFKKDKIK